MKNACLLTFCIALTSSLLFAACLTSDDDPKTTADGDIDAEATDVVENSSDDEVSAPDVEEEDESGEVLEESGDAITETEAADTVYSTCDITDYEDYPWDRFCAQMSNENEEKEQSAVRLAPRSIDGAYNWITERFEYDAAEDALLITGGWTNMLPVCACGLDYGTACQMHGFAVVQQYIDEHGVGQRSGLLTIRLDLATGDSYAVSRSIGDVTTEPDDNPLTFSWTISIVRPAGTISVILWNGCLTMNPQCPWNEAGIGYLNESDTRQIPILSGSGVPESLNLCGRNEAGEEDCNLPAPSSEPVTVVQKTPGAYTCDAQGCVLVEETR